MFSGDTKLVGMNVSEKRDKGMKIRQWLQELSIPWLCSKERLEVI
jgi:hypothetical protein